MCKRNIQYTENEMEEKHTIQCILRPYRRSSCAGMHIASSYYESDTELDTLAMKWSLEQTGK